jgi:Tfp pilus assembly protein PilP
VQQTATKKMLILMIARVAVSLCLMLVWGMAPRAFANEKEKRPAKSGDVPPPPPPDNDAAGLDDGGDEAEPVREFGAPVQELPPNTRVEDIIEPSADYHYAGFGRPDPFQPPVSVQAVVPDAVEIPIVSPLQRYPLKELKLVGVWMRAQGDRKALVMTPANEGIIVKAGDPVGSGGGKVLSIGDSWMLVREFLLAEDGTRQFTDSRIIFESKSDSSASGSGRGSIVITPGSSRPQLILPAGSSPSAVAPVPANQVPAARLRGAGGNDAGDAAAPAPGAAAGVTPQTQSSQTSPQVPGAPAVTTSPATPTSPQQNKSMYNF